MLSLTGSILLIIYITAIAMYIVCQVANVMLSLFGINKP